MQLIITVNMDNAAFDNNPYEIKHILQKAASLIEWNLENIKSWVSYWILDSNGNKVWRITIQNSF